MTKYQTLIFVPEGSLLNEKTAEQVALRQTLKSSVMILDQLNA